jgi:hypothetical protein
LMSDATDLSDVNAVTIVVLVLLCGSFDRNAGSRWVEEGLLYLHLVLSHGFPDYMNYILSFPICFFPVFTWSFSFL